MTHTNQITSIQLYLSAIHSVFITEIYTLEEKIHILEQIIS